MCRVIPVWLAISNKRSCPGPVSYPAVETEHFSKRRPKIQRGAAILGSAVVAAACKTSFPYAQTLVLHRLCTRMPVSAPRPARRLLSRGATVWVNDPTQGHSAEADASCGGALLLRERQDGVSSLSKERSMAGTW